MELRGIYLHGVLFAGKRNSMKYILCLKLVLAYLFSENELIANCFNDYFFNVGPSLPKNKIVACKVAYHPLRPPGHNITMRINKGCIFKY